MTFGERLKHRREELGISQVELADLTGMSQAQISRYEMDSSQPTIHSLVTLAKALNISADWLLDIRQPMGHNSLDSQEAEVLRLFREKPSHKKKVIFEFLTWA